MRVVVTGAAGFIGSTLCDALIEAGHSVVGVDCFTDYYSREDKERNIASAKSSDGFEFVEADLRVDDLDPILHGADVVVNEAATPGLVLSWDDFDRYQSTNLSAVKRLIDASIRTGIGHFIQASTSSVYGADATGDEDSLCLPVSPYGVTKLAAEHLLRAHAETTGLPLTVLRYFSIYGPRQRPDMAYRIFCERLMRGLPITVYGDGRQSRSNTFIDDCVSATIAAMAQEPVGAVYNVGGGREIELMEAIEILAEALDVEPVVEFAPARRGDQRRTSADTRRARSELGWQPAVEPAQGLLAEVAWLRQLEG